MLRPDDVISGIDYDEELEVVVVRTERATDYEEKLKKKVRTSGCAQGTVFGDVMEQFEQVELPADAILKTSAVRARQEDQHPPGSTSRLARSHGCPCWRGGPPAALLEDVSRPTAIGEIAGYIS